MKKYLVNKPGKFSVQIFLCYTDIAIFALGNFILPQPVYLWVCVTVYITVGHMNGSTSWHIWRFPLMINSDQWSKCLRSYNNRLDRQTYLYNLIHAISILPLSEHVECLTNFVTVQCLYPVLDCLHTTWQAISSDCKLHKLPSNYSYLISPRWLLRNFTFA